MEGASSGILHLNRHAPWPVAGGSPLSFLPRDQRKSTDCGSILRIAVALSAGRGHALQVPLRRLRRMPSRMERCWTGNDDGSAGPLGGQPVLRSTATNSCGAIRKRLQLPSVLVGPRQKVGRRVRLPGPGPASTLSLKPIRPTTGRRRALRSDAEVATVVGPHVPPKLLRTASAIGSRRHVRGAHVCCMRFAAGRKLLPVGSPVRLSSRGTLRVDRLPQAL